MERKHKAKKDFFFYAFVLFTMVVVVLLNVAAEYFYRASEAYFSQADEDAAPRTVATVDQSDISGLWYASGRLGTAYGLGISSDHG